MNQVSPSVWDGFTESQWGVAHEKEQLGWQVIDFKGGLVFLKNTESNAVVTVDAVGCVNPVAQSFS